MDLRHTDEANEHAKPSKIPRRGGLFRRLLFPTLAVSFLTALLSAFVMNRLQIDEGRAQLRESLEGKVDLLERLRLPMSSQLVINFAETSGRPVAALDSTGQWRWSKGWSEQEKALAERAVNEPSQLISGDSAGALALPLKRRPGFLIGLEHRTASASWRDPRVWLAFASALFLGALTAFLLARALVNPMRQLVNKAPSLDYSQLPSSLTERKDELGTLAQALQDASHRANEEREKRKAAEDQAILGRITMSLAHEIRNPAAAIIAQADELDTPTQAAAIREEAEEILSLVNQWLFLARPAPPKAEELDLSDVLAEVGRRLESLASFRHCRIEIKTEGPLHLEGDRSRLLQVIRNLSLNGIAAMPEGGTLQLRAKAKPDAIEVIVSDEGNGFSEQALTHAGEAFFSEREGGMGLGLALVGQVVGAHGGTVSFGNTETGAEVRLTLRKKLPKMP